MSNIVQGIHSNFSSLSSVCSFLSIREEVGASGQQILIFSRTLQEEASSPSQRSASAPQRNPGRQRQLRVPSLRASHTVDASSHGAKCSSGSPQKSLSADSRFECSLHNALVFCSILHPCFSLQKIHKISVFHATLTDCLLTSSARGPQVQLEESVELAGRGVPAATRDE